MSKQNALIVEDTKANRDFFERLLAQAGFTITGVETGNEALDAIEAFDSLTLAVIDMEIPDMSGLDLTRRIRNLYPDACLIVATMHDEPSLMQSAFDKGCDVFMVKPHGFMELFKKLTSDGSDALHEQRPLMIDQFGLRPFLATV